MIIKTQNRSVEAPYLSPPSWIEVIAVDDDAMGADACGVAAGSLGSSIVCGRGPRHDDPFSPQPLIERWSERAQQEVAAVTPVVKALGPRQATHDLSGPPGQR